MSCDFNALMRNHYGTFDAMLREIADAAYEQGFQAGMEKGAELTNALGELNASMKSVASQVLSITADTRARTAPLIAARRELERSIAALPASDATKSPRARRGIVGENLSKALTEFPGLIASDYERIVTGRVPAISSKSVGNELRRGERDGRYERDRPGGYRWYLKGEAPEAEGTPGKETSAPSSDQGGSDGTAIA